MLVPAGPESNQAKVELAIHILLRPRRRYGERSANASGLPKEGTTIYPTHENTPNRVPNPILEHSADATSATAALPVAPRQDIRIETAELDRKNGRFIVWLQFRAKLRASEDGRPEKPRFFSKIRIIPLGNSERLLRIVFADGEDSCEKVREAPRGARQAGRAGNVNAFRRSPLVRRDGVPFRASGRHAESDRLSGGGMMSYLNGSIEIGVRHSPRKLFRRLWIAASDTA